MLTIDLLTAGPLASREAAEYAKLRGQIKALEVKADALKGKLVAKAQAPWLAANRNKVTSTIKFSDGVEVRYALRKKILPSVPDRARPCFDESFKVTIDGSALPADERQKIIDRIAKLKLPAEAIKAEAGFVARKDAMPTAIMLGKDTVEFVRTNAGFAASVIAK